MKNGVFVEAQVYEDRLKELQTHLLNEQRSANPSKMYIEDLKASIKAVKQTIEWKSK